MIYCFFVIAVMKSQLYHFVYLLIFNSSFIITSEEGSWVDFILSITLESLEKYDEVYPSLKKNVTCIIHWADVTADGQM